MSDLSSSSSGPPKDESTGSVCTHLTAWGLCLRGTFPLVLATAWPVLLRPECALPRKSYWLHTGAVGPFLLSFWNHLCSQSRLSVRAKDSQGSCFSEQCVGPAQQWTVNGSRAQWAGGREARTEREGAQVCDESSCKCALGIPPAPLLTFSSYAAVEGPFFQLEAFLYRYWGC